MRVSEVEALLGDPTTYAGDPDRARTLSDQLTAARKQAEALTERWAELEAKQES